MQEYPLRGRFWDGFKPLSDAEITFAKTGLCQEIEKNKSLESFFQGREGDCLQNLSCYEANIEKNSHYI